MARPFLSHVITDDSALGGSVIERSLRFNNDDGTYLERTPSGAGNRKKWTFSAWIKRSGLGFEQRIFGGQANASHIYFETNEYVTWDLANENSSTPSANLSAQRYFRDPTAWFHLVCALDTDESTANNRMRMYINGSEVSDYRSRTNPSSGYSTNAVNAASVHTIGRRLSSQGSDGMRLHGYVAEVNFIDGYQYDASYFGYTESQTGIWRPKKYEGTYGTNGFHLDFSDNSSVTTLGIDKSPNGNDFTPNNFSVSAGTGNDSVSDSPTNNFCTLNPLAGRGGNYLTLANGNLDFTITPSSTYPKPVSSFNIPTSGKWYAEWVFTTIGSAVVGVGNVDKAEESGAANQLNGINLLYNGDIRVNDSQTQGSFTSWSANDVIGVKVDRDAGTIAFTLNGSAQGNPENISSMNTPTDLVFWAYRNAGGGTDPVGYVNFGQRPFSYLPSGFKALSTKNLPPNVPSIIRPQKHFENLLYTGTGSSNIVEGLEFSPDMIWVKGRDTNGYEHMIIDSVRGGNKSLVPNSNDTESTHGGRSMTFYPGGVRWNSDSGNCNANGENYVMWCWKAGGAAVTNTNGNITSSVSVNEEAGFSIVSYTGNGSNGQTVGHGLSKAPQWIMLKSRTAGSNWRVWQHKLASDGSKRFLLDATNASEDASFLNDTAPSSTVFTLGNSDNAWNVNSGTYMAYCWHEVPGYSKFGSYTGNGSSDGVYVHLGFRPAWILIKSATYANEWSLFDTARKTFNVGDLRLEPNSSNAEDSNSVNYHDILSNGFKMRNSDAARNGSGATYIYMAFAEQPGTTPFETFPNAR